MVAFEISIRIIGATLAMLLAFVVWRDGPSRRSAYLMALALAGIAGYLVSHSAVVVPVATPLMVLASLLSKTTLIFLWWLALAMFDDEFRIDYRHAALLVGWILLVLPDFAFIQRLFGFAGDWPARVRLVAAAAIAIHLIARVLVQRHEDLIEARRRWRLVFVAGVTGLLCAEIGADLVFGVGTAPLWFGALQKTAVFAALAWLALSLLRLDARAGWLAGRPAPRGRLSARERDLKQRLDRLIEHGVVLQHDLTIRALAARLGVGEARLRELVSKAFGFGNFRAFVNHYRVEAAKRALEDPGHADVPVVTVALEAGFGSLASFNRVFKQRTGVTPTEYRARAMSAAP